jgi:ADP-ribose pyrophosphatase YjhB (NUDIX family)
MTHQHFRQNRAFSLFLIFITPLLLLKADSSPDQILSFKVNRYNDVEVTVLAHTPDQEKFEEQLITSRALWKEKEIKAAVLALPTSFNAYLPIVLKHHFKIHHATPEQIVLTLLIKGTSEKIQPFPKTVLSVAAIVIDKNNISVVKDKNESQELGAVGYKLPGGYVDYGENLHTAAIREVKEETGIDTEFESIIAFRHSHNQWWEMESMSKLYFCCVLKPLSTAITYDSDEIAEIKWMDFNEFKNTTKGVFAEFVQIFQQNNSFGFGQASKNNGVFYKATKKVDITCEEL